MAATISAQPARVPIGSARFGDQTVDVYIRREWLRFLTVDLPSFAGTVTNAANLANGQVVVGDGGTAGVKTLAAGTNGYVLTMVAGFPAWTVAAAGGGLTIEEVDGAPSVSATKLVFPNGTLSVVGTVATYTPTAGSGTVTKGAAWDGAGFAIVAGTSLADVAVYCPDAKTITKVTVLTRGGTGSCVIDIWKAAYGSFPPTVANTITAAAKPTISSATKYQSSTLTGWTTSVSAGDVLMFHVDSTSTFTYLEIILELS